MKILPWKDKSNPIQPHWSKVKIYEKIINYADDGEKNIITITDEDSNDAAFFITKWPHANITPINRNKLKSRTMCCHVINDVHGWIDGCIDGTPLYDFNPSPITVREFINRKYDRKYNIIFLDYCDVVDEEEISDFISSYAAEAGIIVITAKEMTKFNILGNISTDMIENFQYISGNDTAMMAAFFKWKR